jgi:hypothetical protein
MMKDIMSKSSKESIGLNVSDWKEDRGWLKSI